MIIDCKLPCTNAYRMDDLSDFLRQRKVPEENIEALEEQKVGYKCNVSVNFILRFHGDQLCSISVS